MIEAEIPKNILKRKSKVFAGFTLRQIIGGVAGFGLGIAAYFFCFSALGDSLRIGLSSLVALPFLLIGFASIYEQPFEKMAYIIVVENFIYPPKRLYETRYEMDKPSAKKKKEIKKSRKYKAFV